MRVAIVMGPTPPGTGVIYDAFAKRFQNHVSAELTLAVSVNADIDYDGAVLDHIRRDKSRPFPRLR